MGARITLRELDLLRHRRDAPAPRDVGAPVAATVEQRRDELAVRIWGRAVPAGSKDGFTFLRPDGRVGVRLVDCTGTRGTRWRELVQWAVREALPRGWARFPAGTPLELEAAFAMQRPKAHGRADGTLAPLVPTHPTTRPDLTKLVRALEDALTGLVWADDAAVVAHRTAKTWAPLGSGPFVDLTVRAAGVPRRPSSQP